MPRQPLVHELRKFTTSYDNPCTIEHHGDHGPRDFRETAVCTAHPTSLREAGPSPAIPSHAQPCHAPRGKPLLIFANKQDLPFSLSAAELVKILELKALRQQWQIFESSFQKKQGATGGTDAKGQGKGRDLGPKGTMLEL